MKSFCNRKLFRAVLVACVGFAVTAFVEGQSGRRVPNKPSQPPPTTREAEPPPPPSEPEKPKTALLLVSGGDLTTSTFFDRGAIQSCERRLKSSTVLDVRTGKAMNRSEASKYAKSMNQHVASLAVEGERDMMNSRVRLSDVWVRYVLFISGTGKIKADGRVYLRPPRVGAGVPLPVPQSDAAIQYAVEEAGKEAAERILSALDLSPALRRP